MMISTVGSGGQDKVNRDLVMQSRVAQAAQQVQGRENNGNQSARMDIAEISGEALEGVQKGSGSSESPLFAALQEAFQAKDDREGFGSGSEGLVPGQELKKIEENITKTRSWEPTAEPHTVHTSGQKLGVVREEFDVKSSAQGGKGVGPDLSKKALETLLKKVRSEAGPGLHTPEGRNSGSQVRIEGNRVLRESHIETESTRLSSEPPSPQQQRFQARPSGDVGPSEEVTSQSNSKGLTSPYPKLDGRPNLTPAQVAGIQGMTAEKAADHLEQSAAQNPHEAQPGLAEELRKLRAD